jgi:hypothetical protein
MVIVLASSAVDRVFDRQLGKTKDNNNGMCCFSAHRATLKSKCNDWLILSLTQHVHLV